MSVREASASQSCNIATEYITNENFQKLLGMSFHLTARNKVNLLKRAGLYIRKATGAFLLRFMNKIIDFWSPQRYLITRQKQPPEVFYQRLDGIKTRFFFFGTHVKNYYMYHPDNNYYSFCKSTISVTNLIVGPRNMIKV